jgi:hypothetical protein
MLCEKVFKAVDLDGNNLWSFEEVKEMLKQIQYYKHAAGGFIPTD